jgi:hypothetical protein
VSGSAWRPLADAVRLLLRRVMIVRPHPNAAELLFSCSGSIVPAITPQIVVAALVGAVAAFLRHGVGSLSAGEQADASSLITFTPFTALGVAISLFLGFRNNAAYERWWEGRRQWGTQLIAVRNFSRLLAALKISDDDRRALIRLAVAHTHATRAQLRATWRIGLHDSSWVCCSCCRGRRQRRSSEQQHEAADGGGGGGGGSTAAELTRERDQ